jgi:uncharacterized protein with HEPN domain
MSERNARFLLNDMSESISNILNFTKGMSYEQYCNDLKTRHAVEHNFMIIGEAAGRIPVEFKEINKSVNWREVKDFRNIIVHDYFGIDNSIVWDIINLNLLELDASLQFILSRMSD